MAVFGSLFPREAKKEKRRKAQPGKVVTAKRRLAKQAAERKERERLAKLAKIKERTEYNIAKAEKAESEARRRRALRKAREEHPVFRALGAGKRKGGKRRKKAWWE